MRFLLDTNAVIALLRADPEFTAKLQKHSPADFVLSAIVTHELFFGAFKGRRVTENLARVDALRFEVLPFEYEDARRAGEIRALLAATGNAIGPYDVLIAGQALARSLVLITHNVREFSRVLGLKFEDWES